MKKRFIWAVEAFEAELFEPDKELPPDVEKLTRVDGTAVYSLKVDGEYFYAIEPGDWLTGEDGDRWLIAAEDMAKNYREVKDGN